MQDQELAKIVEEIIGPRPQIVTLVPYKRELVSPGPNMEVYLEYPEVVPGLRPLRVTRTVLPNAHQVRITHSLGTIGNFE